MRSTPLLFPEPEQWRVREASARKCLIDGPWVQLLAAHMALQLGQLRARLIGIPDDSSNLFRSALEQLGGRYDTPPTLRGGTGPLSVALDDWWPQAGHHEQYVRGFNESLVYVSWDEEMNRPTFEMVTPDLVSIEGAASNPRRPVVVWLGRERKVPGKEEKAWFWDRFDVRDPHSPSLTIWTNDRRHDVTRDHLKDPDSWQGPRYSLRDSERRPILPFALWHARGAIGKPWYPLGRHEVVTGTLQVGMLWSTAVYGFTRAGFDQRVVLNGKVRGGAIEESPGKDGRAQFLTPDPSRVLRIDGDNATIDSWGAAIDIVAAERFCRMYESRLGIHFGLTPGDVVIEALNPASGASLTVSERGKRRIAIRDAINFRRGDLRLIDVVAATYRAHGVEARSEGASLRYHGFELGLEERQKAVQVARDEMALGLSDEVSAYQLIHPGCSTEDAISDLEEQHKRRIERQRRQQRSVEMLERRAELERGLGPQAGQGQGEGQGEDDGAEPAAQGEGSE